MPTDQLTEGGRITGSRLADQLVVGYARTRVFLRARRGYKGVVPLA
jgi:hypothetical protein